MAFNKALSEPFMRRLESIAEEGGWWSDVLHDKAFLIALRGKFFNMYWQGQSLFKVGFASGTVTASTHQKYLVDPDLADQVHFDGWEFAVRDLVLT